MTKQELLEKAKKDYPIGSEFLDVENNKITTVYGYAYYDSGIIYSHNQGSGGRLLYKNGIWAKIISSPVKKSEIINNYEIF